MNLNKALLMLMLAACFLGGCVSGKEQAKRILSEQLQLPKDQIEVHQVSGFGNTQTVEASLKLTFLLQKEGRNWRILKIRRQSDDWQPPAEFFESFPRSSLSSALHSAFVRELE